MKFVTYGKNYPDDKTCEPMIRGLRNSLTRMVNEAAMKKKRGKGKKGC